MFDTCFLSFTTYYESFGCDNASLLEHINGKDKTHRIFADNHKERESEEFISPSAGSLSPSAVEPLPKIQLIRV